ncbi:erythroferrone-like isoform X2 [Hemitrygon akajei]|uniref:erythroferrone-like isoform X2 n=1 Tax=Hemitrygon akajei TaxID=2704970 RepID=UPI003BF9F623
MATSLAELLTITLCVDFVLFKLVQPDRSAARTMGRKPPPTEKGLDQIINVPDSQQLPDLPVDPRDSWLLFVEHSEKGVNERRKNKGKARKTQHGLPGPPGPPGPQGPPGAVVTHEVLLKEFKEMLKEVVEERNRISSREKCQECLGFQDILAYRPLLPSEMGQYHRLEAAFHCKLKDDLVMGRKSLRELQNFHIPEKDGVFLRGIGLNLTSGQYVAPVAGFYQFSANLHIGLWKLSMAWVAAVIYLQCLSVAPSICRPCSTFPSLLTTDRVPPLPFKVARTSQESCSARRASWCLGWSSAPRPCLHLPRLPVFKLGYHLDPLHHCS